MGKKSLTIINFNANGIRRQMGEFPDFLKRHDVDIACVTETHLKINERFSLPGYSVYHNARTNGPGGGTAIFTKQNIQPAIDDNNTNIENTSIITSINGRTTRLTAVYAAPNRNFDKKVIKRWTKYHRPQDRATNNKLVVETKANIAHYKENSWHRFIPTIESEEQGVWKLNKILRGNKKANCPIFNGQKWIFDVTEQAGFAADHFSNQFTNNKTTDNNTNSDVLKTTKRTKVLSKP